MDRREKLYFATGEDNMSINLRNGEDNAGNNIFN